MQIQEQRYKELTQLSMGLERVIRVIRQMGKLPHRHWLQPQ